MSDPCGELVPALIAALKADASVSAAMGGKAKVYDVAPTGAAKPYVHFSQADVAAEEAECIAGAEAEITFDVWSLTSPPGRAEAMAIAKAVQAAMLAVAEDALASYRLSEPIPVRMAHLIDLDGKTAHSVVTVRFPAEPLTAASDAPSILTEDGDYILTEDGSKVLTE